MIDFNWCHGPKCHEKHTVDRVRGVKGSKVLRTRKVPQNKWNSNTFWRFFCSQTCMHDFVTYHCAEFIEERYPRTECLETPILDPRKETHTHDYSWGRHSYTDTKIEVDESRQID